MEHNRSFSRKPFRPICRILSRPTNSPRVRVSWHQPNRCGYMVRCKLMTHRCPYCRESFTPSRYRPDQVVCSGKDCQRHRRSEYHRRKITDDPAYQAQCHDSQKKWRDLHPQYMQSYRKTMGRSQRTKSPKTHDTDRLQQLLELVKNNVALNLKHCTSEAWIICSRASVKNILA